MPSPVYTAPLAPLSTMIVAVPPLLPEIVPSSVAKMKFAGVAAATSHNPAPYPLHTCPVGSPDLSLLLADGGMAAAVTPTPAVLYSVAKPFDVFDTQIRLPGDADIPHDPTRFGSVLSATPSMSATRLCCTKFEAAKA